MATKKPVKKAATKKPAVKKPAAKTTTKKTVKKAAIKKVKAKAAVEETSAMEYTPVRSFLSMHGGMDPEQQARMIAEQTKHAFDVEAFVQFNVAQTQVARSIVEENVTDAMQSWAINAGGNREMIMRTTDDVYRNRVMMLNLLTADTPEQAAFQESLINKTKLDYLQHRNQMNKRMVEISFEMAKAIQAIGEASQKFFDANEEMAAFVDDVANENAQWLDGELVGMMKEASNITNDKRIQETLEITNILAKDAESNRRRIKELSEFAQGLGESLNELQDSGNDLRDEVTNLREKIDANQRRIGDTIIRKK